MARAKYSYVKMPTLEDLQEKYKDFFKFKFKNGIIEVKMHSDGGPALWSYQMHNALCELYTDLGHAKWIECIIFTSTGPYWIHKTDHDSFKEVEESPDNDARFNVQIYDTVKVVENFVNDIEVPTVAAINGRGFHWEMALMCDITLCTPDFILQDDHFGMKNGHVPGDGMTMILQAVCGIKRGNYMSLLCKGIDAEECLRIGAVNEIVERDKIVDRAWEIAETYIMPKSRSCRRLSHDVWVGPWREWVHTHIRRHVMNEMYSFNLSASSHDFDYIKYPGEE